MLGSAILFSALAALATAAPANKHDNTPSYPDGTPAQQHALSGVSQPRLAFHGTGGMTVSWSTLDEQKKPTVHYGTSPDKLNKQAHSKDSTTYATSDLYANHVSIDGLQPGTKYYYQIEGSQNVSSFTTAKAAGDRTPYTMAVVVDMGTMGWDGLSEHLPKGVDNALKPGEINTVQRLAMQLDDYEFITHPGDISYGDYWLKETVLGYLQNASIDMGPQLYHTITNDFYNQMTPITSTKAYMMGVGNHEANCDNGGYKKAGNESICPFGLTNFTDYKNHWKMPSDVSGSGGGNFWYSYDVGMVHYLMFDTETDFPNGLIGASQQGGVEGFGEAAVGSYQNAQYDFIKNDLAKVDRTKTPWVVASAHRPWYVSADPSDQFYTAQAAFEQLLYDGGVDVVLHGHVHNIQRTLPIFNNVTDAAGYNNPKAPFWLCLGNGGHFDGLDPIVYPLQEFTAFANDTAYGYGLLSFHNSTHMTYEARASADNSVLDTVTLYKEHGAGW